MCMDWAIITRTHTIPRWYRFRVHCHVMWPIILPMIHQWPPVSELSVWVVSSNVTVFTIALTNPRAWRIICCCCYVRGAYRCRKVHCFNSFSVAPFTFSVSYARNIFTFITRFCLSCLHFLYFYFIYPYYTYICTQTKRTRFQYTHTHTCICVY